MVLHEHWRTVDAVQLEEVAVDIWKKPEFRDLAPDEAATRWLSPVTAATASSDTAIHRVTAISPSSAKAFRL